MQQFPNFFFEKKNLEMVLEKDSSTQFCVSTSTQETSQFQSFLLTYTVLKWKMAPFEILSREEQQRDIVSGANFGSFIKNSGIPFNLCIPQ